MDTNMGSRVSEQIKEAGYVHLSKQVENSWTILESCFSWLQKNRITLLLSNISTSSKYDHEYVQSKECKVGVSLGIDPTMLSSM